MQNIPQNSECPHCPNRCGGVCQMVEPVVCPGCGHVVDAESWWETAICADMLCASCMIYDVRPIPEPHDPDLGALHGVTTQVGEILTDWVWFNGPAGEFFVKDKDPTGERAFLRAVGEE